MTRRSRAAARAATTATPSAQGHLLCAALPPPAAPAPAQQLLFELVVLIAAAARLSGWELSRLVGVCRTWRAALTSASALWRDAIARDFADGAPAQRLVATLAPRLLHSLRAVPSLLRTGSSSYGYYYAAESLRCCDTALRGTRARRDFRKVTRSGGPVADPFLAAAVPAPATGVREWATVRVVERQAWRHWLGGYVREPIFCCFSCDEAYHEQLKESLEVPVPRMREVHGELTAYWHNLAQPYALQWTAEVPALGEAAVARQPRRLRLHDALRTATPGDVDADYKLYTALASALLPGRCRACNRPTDDVHAALRVPMCAKPACAGAYAAAAADGAAKATTTRRRAWRPRHGARRTAAQRERGKPGSSAVVASSPAEEQQLCSPTPS
jgi:hypothetical protein